MGNPMAGHLSKTFSTMVYNRTQSKTDVWLETYKGQTCTNPAELGKNCNEVFLCIGNDDDVRKTVSGEEGLLSEMQPGGIIVDHTTTSAELAREMHHLSMQKGVSYIDAPVSGGQAGAEAGSLTIMAGGDTDAFEKISSTISTYSKFSKLMGPSISAHVLNIFVVVINNFSDLYLGIIFFSLFYRDL